MNSALTRKCNRRSFCLRIRSRVGRNSHTGKSNGPIRERCYDEVRLFSAARAEARGNLDGVTANDEEEGEAEPWKTLLQMPARARWRVTSPAPVALEEARSKILSGARIRSNKILKNTLQDMISSHRKLANRRERERRRIIDGTEYKKGDTRGGSAIKPVLYGPEETLASFKFRLVSNYAITKRVLEETRSLIGADTWHPKRVIDFGIGCASASAAAMDIWPDSIEWIHGIDPSQTVREGAKAFLDDFAERNEEKRPSTIPPRITVSAHFSEGSSPLSSSAAFDLALFVYTATELPQISSTLAAAAILWEKLHPNGIFVMIEPGTPDGFSSIRTVRNMLLDSCPPDSDSNSMGEEECHILAPCVHNGSCPMESYHNRSTKTQQPLLDVDEMEVEGETIGGADDTSVRRGFCSFVQTMPSEKSKGEKFSYLVAQKRLSGHAKDGPPHRFDDVSLTDLLSRYQADAVSVENAKEDQLIKSKYFSEALALEDRFLESDDDNLGLEFLRGDKNRSSFGRIIQAPRKKKGHVLIDCCVGPGKMVTHTISKSMSNTIPGIYQAARKSRWGGYWPQIIKPIEK